MWRPGASDRGRPFLATAIWFIGVGMTAGQLIPKEEALLALPDSFVSQALAFPSCVERALAKIETVEQAKDMLDKSATLQAYAKQLKASVAIERPIAIGVIKIKAKLGQLMIREKGGRGKKTSKPALPLSKPTAAAYRKLAEHSDKLDDYYEDTEDVPTQGDFIRWATGGNRATVYSGNQEWYTPAPWIARVLSVLGEIDLDPASSESANRVVGASEFYTEQDDGLSQAWRGRVFCNPPYKAPVCGLFAEKLRNEYASDAVPAGILLTNNCTDTAWFQDTASACSAICFPRGRIAFYNDDGQSNAPTNGPAFFYFGAETGRFGEVFGEVGLVWLN